MNKHNMGNEPRKYKAFYCQGIEASWEDMYHIIGKDAMMHDYPYYFDENGNDTYPHFNFNK